MSRTYYSNNEPQTYFDVNVCGVQLLNVIHAKINVGCRDWYGEKHVITTFSKEMGEESAEAINSLNDDQFEEIYNESRDMWGGTKDGLKEFILSWANFLKNNGGCYVM